MEKKSRSSLSEQKEQRADAPVSSTAKEEKISIKDFYKKKVLIGGQVETEVKTKREDDEDDVRHDPFSYLWSSHEDERLFEDKDGEEFKIKFCRTSDTEAILLRPPGRGYRDYSWSTEITTHTAFRKYHGSKDGYEYQEPDSPVVFRTVDEVITYLRKRATKVEVCCYELNPWNYRRHDKMGLSKEAKDAENNKYGEYIPGDDILWNLFVETVVEKRKKHENLRATIALPMAREFLLADQGLLKVADELILTLDSTGGRVMDDHRSYDKEGRILGDGAPITLMRKEYRLAPGAIGAYKTGGDRSARVESYGMPAVTIGRRINDIHHRDHDEAWLCGFNTCGNPYYRNKKDGLIHISTCATGQWERPTVDHPPFCGRVDTSHHSSSRHGNTGRQAQAQVTITIGQLRSLIKELTPSTSLAASSFELIRRDL